MGVDWRVIDDARPLAAAVLRPAWAADPASIEAYQRDGVVLLPGAFTDWVEPLRAGLQRNLDAPDDYAFPCESTEGAEPGRFFDSYCNWQRIPEFLAFALASPAASIAAQHMGSNTAQLFHEHSFAKEGGTQKATPWHHDLPYYCVDGQQTISVYVALDDTPEDTAVRFLRGSHRSGQIHHPRNFASGASYITADDAMTPAPEPADDHPDVVTTALAAGDALLFDFRTLHGTGPAPVVGRRRAFSTRWLGDDVVYVERPGETSPPLTGLGIEPGSRMREDWFPVLWPPAQ